MEKKLHSFICTEDNVRIGGRTMLENDIRYMDYTCTYVEFTFTGTYAEAEIISDLTPSEDIFCGVHQRLGSACKAIQA